MDLHAQNTRHCVFKHKSARVCARRRMPEVHFSVTEASFSQAPPATTCRLHIMILAIERMSCAHTLLTGTSRAQDPAHFLNPESMPPRLAGASSSREEGAHLERVVQRKSVVVLVGKGQPLARRESHRWGNVMDNRSTYEPMQRHITSRQSYHHSSPSVIVIHQWKEERRGQGFLKVSS
eukprot:3939537-Rhodomonas_salina.3